MSAGDAVFGYALEVEADGVVSATRGQYAQNRLFFDAASQELIGAEATRAGPILPPCHAQLLRAASR